MTRADTWQSFLLKMTDTASDSGTWVGFRGEPSLYRVHPAAVKVTFIGAQHHGVWSAEIEHRAVLATAPQRNGSAYEVARGALYKI